MEKVSEIITVSSLWPETRANEGEEIICPFGAEKGERG